MRTKRGDAMTNRATTYHVGRVLKGGRLDWEGVAQAILEPVSITSRGVSWTVTDAERVELSVGSFLTGKLARYRPDGEVLIVEGARERVKDEPNLLVNSSRFVIDISFSGIGYQRVPQSIESEVFCEKFSELILSKHGGFFVALTVEPIADLVQFIEKVARLDVVESLEAVVEPPNPLFGPLTAPLREYLRRRRTKKLAVKEEAEQGSAINTNLIRAVQAVLLHGDTAQDGPPIDLTDAAICLAADGYGKATVSGRRNELEERVSTKDSSITFDSLREEGVRQLCLRVREILVDVNNRRGLGHNEE